VQPWLNPGADPPLYPPPIPGGQVAGRSKEMRAMSKNRKHSKPSPPETRPDAEGARILRIQLDDSGPSLSPADLPACPPALPPVLPGPALVADFRMVPTPPQWLNLNVSPPNRPDRELTVKRPPFPPRIVLKGDTVFLDGQPVPLDMASESRSAALCLLTHLLAAGGDWRSATELDDMERASPCKDHVGVRWDQVRKKLPPSLLDLTETNRRKGTRLRPSAWRR
jgi:hypothetical protein